MVQRKSPLWRLLALLVATATVLAACGDDGDGDDSTGGDGDGPLSGATITVGSKEFTEQLILGHITKLALEDAGADVDDQIGLQGTQVVRDALTSGTIDLYWEYLGTAWIEIMGNEDSIPDLQEQYDAVAEADAENGITWLEPAPFNDTYAIAVSDENADDLGVSSISDIGTLLEDDPDAVTFCAGGEFATRDDGLPGVEATYGFEIPSGNIQDVDDALVYTQVDSGDCTFGSVFSTDGRIANLGLTVLEDDDAAWPLYHGAVSVRTDVMDEHPEIEDVLVPISEALDQDTMTELNAQVDVEQNEPEDVAQTWLEDNGFIGS